MKKSIKIIYIILFFTVCCTPLVLMSFLPVSEAVGNEPPAEKPELLNDGKINENFSDQFDRWFTQIIPFRPEIITAQNKIESGILMKNNNKVIAGKNGYLFSEETVNDYIGVTVSDREIHNIAETIRLMQEYSNAHNADFVFTVAPNKNTVYPENMPIGYINGKDSNLSKLKKQMEKMNINYVDLEKTLKEQKKNGAELYLKNDTHWNNLAALYSYNAIMQGLDNHHKSYSGISYSTKNDWSGDLSKMLYPSSPNTCMQYYFDMSYDKYKFLKPRAAAMDNNALMENLMGDSEKIDTVIQTRNSDGNGSLYMSRDSFGRSMLPFLIDNYNSTYITRYRSFDLTNIDTAGYNDVVYEIVERNLDTITDITPIIYAPSVDNVIGKEINSDDKNIIKTEKSENSLKVYGVIDSENVSDESNIYIVLSDSNGKAFYEAFPITETSLLELEEKSEYGFTALIETGNRDISNYSVSVVIS